MTELIAMTQAMPFARSAHPEVGADRVAWARPTVRILPNGNIFATWWTFRAITTPESDPADHSYVSVAVLYTRDLVELDRQEFLIQMPAYDINGGVRPYAYVVEDCTVWLLLFGSFSATVATRCLILDCRGESITLIEDVDWSIPGTDLLDDYGFNADQPPQMLYFPEHNLALLCAYSPIAVRNGAILTLNPYFSTSSDWDTIYYRSPLDNTKFGAWTWTGIGSGAPDYIYTHTLRFMEWTVDPLSGTVTGPMEQEAHANTYTLSDYRSPWLQAVPNPYRADGLAVYEWYDAGNNGFSSTFDPRDSFTNATDILHTSPGRGPYIGNLAPENSVFDMGGNTIGQITLAYGERLDDQNDWMLIKVLEVSPRGASVDFFTIPFLNEAGMTHWDSLNSGAGRSINADFRDGVGVIAVTMLDEDYYPEYYHDVYLGSNDATFGLLATFKVGEPEPMRLRMFDEETQEETWKNVFARDGRMRVKVGSEWHHQWSTADDVEDRTKLRYPMMLKMSEEANSWKCVGVFTPDTPATDSTA